MITALAALLLAVSAAPLLGMGGGDGAGAAQPGAAGTAGGAPAAIPAARYAKKVVIITIDREIDAVMAKSVVRRMKLAEEAGADALVFELDTPGGELGAFLEICGEIKKSKISNTVAWVNPTAYSGGSVIALACREMVVNDPATLGDSLVISLNSFGMLNKQDEQERQKFTAPVLAEVVDSARRRGYDEKLVQGFVTRGVELWLIRNKVTGQQVFVGPEEYRAAIGSAPTRTSPAVPSAADGKSPEWSKAASPEPGTPALAPPSEPFVPGAKEMPKSFTENVDRSLADLEYALGVPGGRARPQFGGATAGEWEPVEYVSDGKGPITLKTDRILKYRLASQTVKNDSELQAFFGAGNMVRLNESWSEVLVVALTNWIVRAVIVVIFLTGLFLEMTHPGTILPGSIAALALIALIAPPFLNNMANWWEVAAILVGIVLLALELLVLPGFGVLGVLGLLLLFGGLIGTFTSNNEGLFPDTARGRQDLLHGVLTLALSTVTSGVIIYFVSKHLGSLPIVNRLLLQDSRPGDEDGGAGLLAAMDPESGLAAGQEGVAITPLRPAGRVQVGDRILDVVADSGFIPAGARVRVAAVGEYRTVVERVVEDRGGRGGAADDEGGMA